MFIFFLIVLLSHNDIKGLIWGIDLFLAGPMTKEVEFSGKMFKSLQLLQQAQSTWTGPKGYRGL